MKKAILKTLVATLFIGFMMSSCLGDNTTKMENSNALSYIKQGKTGNIAISSGAVFTNDYVNKLVNGEFYFLNYTINGKDGVNSEGAAIARQVDPVGDGEPVVRGSFDIDQPHNEDQPIVYYPTQMNISLFSPLDKDGLDDNWVFSYETKVYEEDAYKDPATKKDNIRLVATVLEGLEGDQYTGTGENIKPLGEGKVIVRLYIERYSTGIQPNTTKQKVAYKGTASVDLTRLRSYLRLNMPSIGADGSLGIIQFKYMVNINKENEAVKTEAKYLGNLSEERPDFYMAFVE